MFTIVLIARHSSNIHARIIPLLFLEGWGSRILTQKSVPTPKIHIFTIIPLDLLTMKCRSMIYATGINLIFIFFQKTKLYRQFSREHLQCHFNDVIYDPYYTRNCILKVGIVFKKKLGQNYYIITTAINFFSNGF